MSTMIALDRAQPAAHVARQPRVTGRIDRLGTGWLAEKRAGADAGRALGPTAATIANTPSAESGGVCFGVPGSA
jgi:hypothetical protein